MRERNIHKLIHNMDSEPAPQTTVATKATLHRILHDAENFVRRDPAKAIATAFGAGLLLNLVPPRVIVGAITAVAVPFMRPALLSLGLFKVFEMCCKGDNPPDENDKFED